MIDEGEASGLRDETSGHRWNEADRLAALDRYKILDTPAEVGFDDIARIAADVCETPIAVVNLVTDTRQWFKAEIGLGVRETPLDTSFCRHALLEQDLMVVPDATRDPRFECNPLVTGEPHLRFYAGALLKTEEGLPLGTICVLDTRPRDLDEKQVRTLRALARQVMTQLELRRALTERASAVAQQRTVADALPVLISFVDAQERYRFNNKTYEDWFGQPRREVYGRTLIEVLGAEAYEAIRPHVAAALAGRPANFETLARYSKGGERFIKADYLPRFKDDGTVDGFFVLVGDVTARHRSEAALRASEERFRKFSESTREGVVIHDGGTVLDCNAAYARMFGYESVADVVGRPVGDLVAPDGLARIREKHARCDEEPYEVAARRKDGSVFPAEFVGREIEWRGGKARVGLARDVTEQKRAEAVLRELNETLESRVAEALAQRKLWADIFETTDALIGVLDPEYRYLALNKAYADEFERIYGVRARVGDNLLDLLADRPRHQAAVREVWSRALAGEAFTIVEKFGDPARRRPYYELRYATLRDRDGRLVGAFQYAQDVTQRLRDEAQLGHVQEQLRQSQKMEAVGQLTGGVAHDFNNLLQIVTGNLDILQRNLPEDAARLRRAANNAMTGARRAAALTQRLLAFSRRQPLDPKPISVNRLVTDMSDLLGRTLGETIEIETILSGGLWQVEADPNQLESAILNLAVNARDAMPEGGKLTIETANAHLDHAYSASNAEVAPGQYVAICVTDAGAGMDAETTARAFEPFFTTKEVGKGTGLGLSQVYGFVKQSGGNVKIYSELGEGTTVKIYLPRLIGGAEEEEAAADALAPEGSRLETILVVEDDDDVRSYSVEVLRELGYRVLEAHDGPSALRLVERQDGPISLLFCDVVLPGGMTGAVVAKAARAILPELKVLFTTGYARNAIVHQGRLDPGVHLVTKPFTYADLAARVRDILDGQA